jgi:hypothetical protein
MIVVDVSARAATVHHDHRFRLGGPLDGQPAGARGWPGCPRRGWGQRVRVSEEAGSRPGGADRGLTGCRGDGLGSIREDWPARSRGPAAGGSRRSRRARPASIRTGLEPIVAGVPDRRGCVRGEGQGRPCGLPVAQEPCDGAVADRLQRPVGARPHAAGTARQRRGRQGPDRGDDGRRCLRLQRRRSGRAGVVCSVDPGSGSPLVTDGPFAESTEHLGGRAIATHLPRPSCCDRSPNTGAFTGIPRRDVFIGHGRACGAPAAV